MKTDEIKLRVLNYANSIINNLFDDNNTVFGKLKNTTAKYWLKQNIWRLDSILNKFVDVNGEIDIQDAVEFYSNDIFDANGKFTLNLHSIITDDSINQYIPNSIIVFTKDDLNKLFGLIKNNVEEDTTDSDN